MMKAIVSLTVLGLAAIPCFASEPYSSNYGKCMDDSGGVTVEMLNCIGEELERQDAKLNRVYKQLSSQVSPLRKKQLVTAQRNWIQYRDANCNFYADPDGGTLATVSSSECVLRETADRASELQTLASGE